jgi:hypothetical protein
MKTTRQDLITALQQRMQNHQAEHRTNNRQLSYQAIATSYVDHASKLLFDYLIYHRPQDLKVNAENNARKKNLMLWYISVSKLNSSIQAQIPGTRTKWSQWITDNQASIIRVVEKGSNLTNLKSGILPQGVDIMDLINIRLEDTEKFFQETHGHSVEKALEGELTMEFVPVDMRSLQAYINTVQAEILEQSSMHSKRSQMMLTQLAQARSIQALVKETNRQLSQYIPDSKKDYYTDFLVQFTGESDFFGRIYNTGFSLQNVRSEVRVAALGNCHEYDISACVFSVYAHLANDRGVKADSFTAYNEMKQEIREHLAEQMTNTNLPMSAKIKIVKQAITAIGFGANKSTGRWDKEKNTWINNAIADVIYNKEDREIFLSQGFITDLMNDIKALADAVTQDIDPELKQRRELRNDTERGYGTGRFSKKKYLAFLYQNAETMIMDTVLSKHPNAEIMLRVHDAVYSKTPICVDALNHDAQQISPWIRYEEKHHKAWFDKAVAERAAQTEQQNRDELKRLNDEMLQKAQETGYQSRYSTDQDCEEITDPKAYQLADDYQRHPKMRGVILEDEQYGDMVRKILDIRQARFMSEPSQDQQQQDYDDYMDGAE